MRDIAKIAKIVKSVLASDFDRVTILDVRVVEVIDSDDGELLRIEVIFEGTSRDIDITKISGAVRHVRPKLTEIGEKAFPLFSFISRRDAGAAGLEPA